MAVSRTTARVDSESAVHTLDRAIMQWPFLLVRAPINGQASWARVIRHARCADGGLDPDQWFPVSVETGKARHEAAAAIAICTACRGTRRMPGPVTTALGYRPARCLGGLVAAERAALRGGACGLNQEGLCDLSCTRMGKGKENSNDGAGRVLA